jgi:hypothetical protein
MAGDHVLYTMGDDILSAAVAGMAADRRPERQIVVAGPDFAHDCWQIAVELQRMYVSRIRKSGVTSDRPTPAKEGIAVRVAQYQVTLTLLCMPTPTKVGQSMRPPSADDINAAALLVLTDGWDARQGVRDALAAGTILDGCQGAEVGDLVPFGPSGQSAGVRFPVLCEW